jgi:DsbC/DsbD-like thiol-disulfide interchange protein
VRWSAPKGVTFGPLRHPAPVLLNAQGVSSFVHDGPHVLLSRMSLPRSLTPGAAIPIVADLSWAACTATQCVPLRTKLHLQLTAGTGLPGPEAAAIHAAADEVPRAGPNGSFIRTANGIRLQFPAALKLDPRDARFFAEEPSAFDTAGARPDLVDGRLVISADAPGKTPPTLAGVVSDGRSSYRVALFQSREAVAPSAAASPKPIESRSPTNPHEVGQSAAPQRPAQPRAEHSTLSAFVMWALAGAAAAIGAAAFVILRRRI